MEKISSLGIAQLRFFDLVPNDLGKQVTQEYRDGMTIKEICSKHGGNEQTMRGALVRLGVTIRPQGQYGRGYQLSERAKEDYKAGVPITVIARKEDTTAHRVVSALVKAGLFHSRGARV